MERYTGGGKMVRPTVQRDAWDIHVLGSWRDEHKICGDGISNVARGWLGVEWAVDLN